ncbi:MAG: sigma-70 family RNA polymerase sigma factor [Oscillospiraceae bacterium]|nr:sigma-70 family RNA polymerase sigma factor [Oscillospiraceae bacterium]
MTEQQLEHYIIQYRSTVFRLAYSIVKNREDADDITQDAFMKLYISEISFERDENVKAWLIRVTINLSKDLLKSGWRRHRAELTDDIPFESSREELLLDSVKKLKADYSIIIYLFYYERYTVNEIARLRNTTSAAVRTKLTRARGQLRKLLSKEDLF